MKKYVIIGLGNFGFTLAQSLENNDCQVLGIDSSKDVISSVKDSISHAVTGDATNNDVLTTLKVDTFDGAIISIGQDMAPSILVSMHLLELGFKKIIVRAVNDDHEKILIKLGINEIISPEKDMAIKLAERLALKNAIDYLPIHEDYGIVEVIPPASFINKTLIELEIPKNYNCSVIAIKNKNTDPVKKGKKKSTAMNMKIAPGADDVVSKDSILIILGKNTDIDKLQQST